MCSDDRRLCVDKACCEHKHPGVDLYCTRPVGHDGYHIACCEDGSLHNMAVWGHGSFHGKRPREKGEKKIKLTIDINRLM